MTPILNHIPPPPPPPTILKVITCLSLLLFLSCGSEDSTPSPSSNLLIDPIKSLTLNGVTENTITVNWDLLKTETGTINPDASYTVYVETTNNKGVFPNHGSSPETAYTLDNLKNSPAEFEVTGLVNNTPYRIVVEASTSENTSRAHLLAYTASELTDTTITDVEVSTARNQEGVTATWTAKDGAQGYLLQTTQADSENQLTDGTTVVVVCLPESLLCQKGDAFAEQEGGKLKYKFMTITEAQYDLVVVPFNFRDISGLQATDEQKQVQFTTGVLTLLTESETLTTRLDNAAPVMIHGKPSPPKNPSMDFSRGMFTNIENKLYAISYPLTYTEASTETEAGGPLGDLSYLYRYRVAERAWSPYAPATNGVMIALQVDDWSDAAMVQAGYGKTYQVEVIASNAGGVVSVPAPLVFTYKSFPEPFKQSEITVTPGDKSLTATWPEVTKKNGSTVSSYTVLLNDDSHRSPVQSRNTSEMNVVFDGLRNNQPYYITVIPNGEDTGNLFTALSMEIGDALTEGSEAERILTNYTGTPVSYAPQGPPEAVAGLEVTGVAVATGADQAIVTWEKPATGSPASKYELQHLKKVTVSPEYINQIGATVDAELGTLNWEGVASVTVESNSTGKYSNLVEDLNVTSATNVFRVRAVYVDSLGKEWPGTYRHYALGTDPSQPPSAVRDLAFSGHKSSSFTVTWKKPEKPGQNKNKIDAQLDGYRVSWGTDAQVYGQTNVISDPGTLSYAITGLTPGTQYHVRVQAKNDNTEGHIYNVGETNSTYTIKPPGAVTGITYSGHTTNGFTVVWDAVTDAGYGTDGPASVTYLVDWRDQGGSWQSVTRSDYRTNQETLTGFIPGTKYWVRVTATNGFSSTSREGGETWTLSLPEEVTGLMVSVPTYDQATHTGGFTVEWTAPTDTGTSSNGGAATLTGYQVSYREGDSGPYIPVDHVGVDIDYVFTNLTPNAGYQIRVQAQTVVGTGPAVDVFGWAPSPPGAVDRDSITFANASDVTIKITWVASEPGREGGASSNRLPTKYQVEIGPDGGSYTMVTNNYDGTSVTATGLSKSTTYRARITATNVWGEASSVSSATGKTIDETPPGPVKNLKVVSNTDTQVTLSWDHLSADDLGGSGTVSLKDYTVKYKKTADSPFIPIDNKTGEVRRGPLTFTSHVTTTVIGLNPDTSYTFLVVAVNSYNVAGLDDPAPKVVRITAPASPGNLRLAQCAKATSADLAWDASPGATSYKLYRGGSEITNITTSSHTDTGLTPETTYAYTVQACSTNGCSGDSALTTTTLSDKVFKSIIDSGRTPADLTGYDERSQEIFSRYERDVPLVAKYFKPGGSGNKNGTSFADAAGNLGDVLNDIKDASATKIYTVFLPGENYTNGGSMSMKNHVAIIGGVGECLEPSDTVTALNGDNSYRVFYNYENNLTNTALLYGVTITNGRGAIDVYGGGGGGGMYNKNSSPSLVRVTFSENSGFSGGILVSGETGGGMYNENSSPSLERVTFSGNTANSGGGMANEGNSSPILKGVTFSGNKATTWGGGMYNQGNSSPILKGVTFSGNSASSGGGMYNFPPSSPSLVGVTFSGNTAIGNGGGMYNRSSSPSLERVIFSGNSARVGGGLYNWDSSPSLVGVTFSGNTANENGGGMFNLSSSTSLVGVTFSGNRADGMGGAMGNDNNGGAGPLIINTIFWDNTAPNGQQFYFNNDGTAQENLRLYNSILEGGTGNLVSGIANTNFNQEGFVSDPGFRLSPGDPWVVEPGSAPMVISFSNIITNNPGLLPLADNGGSVLTHAITSTSPAVNQGLYVKKKGSTFYYSEDDTVWYSEPDLSGATITPPADAVDINVTDATGQARSDRPDLGAYEAK